MTERRDCPILIAGICPLRMGSRRRLLACVGCHLEDDFEQNQTPRTEELSQAIGVVRYRRDPNRSTEVHTRRKQYLTHGSEEEPPTIDELKPSGYGGELSVERPAKNWTVTQTAGSADKYN